MNLSKFTSTTLLIMSGAVLTILLGVPF